MGDDEFKELYDRMSKQVFSFAAVRLSPEQAKDVISSTFEIVWKKRDSGPTEPAEWPAWVFGIAKNQILQEAQRVRRKHHDNRFINAANLDIAPDPDIAEIVAVSDAARWVWTQLTPAEQHLLNVAFLGSLDKVGAAGLLGISVTAYTTRVTRLRQRIAALHADNYSGEEARRA